MQSESDRSRGINKGSQSSDFGSISMDSNNEEEEISYKRKMKMKKK